MTIPLIEASRLRWLLGGTGVALVAAQALLPTMPDDPRREVAVVAAHETALVASAVAFLVAGALLIFSVAALNALPVVRGRGLARTALVLTGIGAIWPVAGRAGFNLTIVAVSGADRASAVRVARAIDSSAAFTPLLLTLVAFVVGPVLLAVALRRAGLAPVWPAPLWLAGVLVVNGAESSSRSLATVGMVMVAAALIWIGTAVDGRSEQGAAYDVVA